MSGVAAMPRRRTLARALGRDRVAVICGVVIAVLLLLALAAPWVAGADPTAQNMLRTSRDPSAEHWFGTDQFGRDIFARILYGARVSLLVGIAAPLLAGSIGTLVGVVAGYAGGLVDRLVMRVVDLLMAFPSLLLGVLIAAAMGPGLRNVVVALSIAFLPRFVRIARASTLSVRQEPYIEAARATGQRHRRIVLRHVVPNILGPVLVVASLQVATSIRLEATLSFLGLGTQPPSPSWGNIIRDGMNNMLGSPWPIVAAGVSITLAVLAFNLLGDQLGDLFDPTRRSDR
jgi:peptide/nickel transport system permease protein